VRKLNPDKLVKSKIAISGNLAKRPQARRAMGLPNNALVKAHLFIALLRFRSSGKSASRAEE
jgi:hypothetical protein